MYSESGVEKLRRRRGDEATNVQRQDVRISAIR